MVIGFVSLNIYGSPTKKSTMANSVCLPPDWGVRCPSASPGKMLYQTGLQYNCVVLSLSLYDRMWCLCECRAEIALGAFHAFHLFLFACVVARSGLSASSTLLILLGGAQILFKEAWSSGCAQCVTREGLHTQLCDKAPSRFALLSVLLTLYW